MGTSRRLGDDGGVNDPDIRDGGVSDPEIRDGGIQDPDLRDGDIGDPDMRDGGITDPEQRVGVQDPNLAPAAQPMSGGLPIIPIVIGLGVIVVAVAAFSFLGGGGTPAGTTGATAGTGATTAPGATSAPGATTGGGVDPAAEATANLVVTSPDVSGSWTLDGGADVSPTSTIIAAVWTETVDNVDAGYGDLIVLSMGGPVIEGTQATSESGISLGVSISRIDAQGTDVFSHVFASRAGECQVTMARTATGVAGTFTCTGIKDADGHTADATGSFAT